MPKLSEEFYATMKDWVSIEDKMPSAFDLVKLRTRTGKELCGWFTGTGNSFDGQFIKQNDEVIEWKRNV